MLFFGQPIERKDRAVARQYVFLFGGFSEFSEKSRWDVCPVGYTNATQVLCLKT